MRKKRYLELYEVWMEAGLPDCGLCESLKNPFSGRYDKLLSLFTPDYYCDGDYWGYDGSPMNIGNDYLGVDQLKAMHEFTPFRQNIVLLLAAMNGEL